MKVLVLDNYDSFTYNLVYMLRKMDITVETHRNDKIDSNEVSDFDGVVLSPGPGIPSESGNMPQIVADHAGKIPILGICLGHQAIAEHLGAHLINRTQVLHGIQHQMTLTNVESRLFSGLPSEFPVGRYHSWEVDATTLPASMQITGIDNDESVLAMENESERLYGLQFHPESILTPNGTQMMSNFINLICSNA